MVALLLAPSPHILWLPEGENSIFEKLFKSQIHLWQEFLPDGQLSGLYVLHPFCTPPQPERGHGGGQCWGRTVPGHWLMLAMPSMGTHCLEPPPHQWRLWGC